MADTPLHAWLEFADGRRHPLASRCTIGRDLANDLVLTGDQISRQHALIASDAHGATLSDLRSRNGTFCNGQAVSRPQLLRDGDSLRCGDVVMTFRCPEPKVAAASNGDEATRLVSQIDMREAWLLLLDIEGYSGLVAQLGTPVATERVQQWIRHVGPQIEHHGGTINRYLGDAIFAFWPDAPGASARFGAALRAVQAAQRSSPVAFRIVAHRGSVAFSRSDNGQELGGQVVNFLFRAEKTAKAHGAQVLLSTAVAEALAWTGAGRVIDGVQLDGIEGRFTFFAFSVLPDGP